MPPSRIAVFPGSFDPLTNGHVDLIRRATRLFDRVIVAVAVNAGKQPLFTLDERMAMILEACAGIAPPGHLEADAFEGLLVDYVARHGACAVIRGLRGGADFEYERPMTAMNAHLAPEIDTVCLMASNQYAHISSRLVKEVASLGGNIEGLVPDAVAPRLIARVKSAAQTRS